MKIKLIKVIKFGIGSGGGDIGLERWIELPSLPTPGLILVFGKNYKFDTETVKNVLYNVVTGAITANVEDETTYKTYYFSKLKETPTVTDFEMLVDSYLINGWFRETFE